MAKNDKAPTDKTVNLEKTLGQLSPEAKKAFAEQYNGGLGSGMSPEEYKRYVQSLTDGSIISKMSDDGILLDDSNLTPYSHKADLIAADHIRNNSSTQSITEENSQSGDRPDIEANVWSRFDDDGWGIHNVQLPDAAENGNK